MIAFHVATEAQALIGAICLMGFVTAVFAYFSWK